MSNIRNRVVIPRRARRSIAALALYAFAPTIAFAATELRCETKYHFFAHLRRSSDRGDCTSMDTVDGPALGATVLDEKGGKLQKADKLVSVEVISSKLAKPRGAAEDAPADASLTKIKQLKVDEQFMTTTASTEGYLRPQVGDLLLQHYINEVDDDSKNPCVNSRFLKVTCRLVPKE